MGPENESDAAMVEETVDQFECRFETTIALPRTKAFELVVDHPELWWVSPFLETKGMKVDVGIEPYVGGMCYQIDADGQQQIWGTVLSIESPLFVRIAWQVSQEGAQIVDPAAASRVVLNFRQAGDVTRLEVVHSNFLRHGENGGDYMKELMQSDGWPRTLDRLRNAANDLPRT